MKKDSKGIDIFAVISIIIITLMFTISTIFIIWQCINSVKIYNNITNTCVSYIVQLKEFFTANITQEVYSLIYSFMSTAIVGLGGYILKNNNDTKEKIKKSIEKHNQEQYLAFKEQFDEDVYFSILISHATIAHQYISAVEIKSTEEEISYDDYHYFIDSVRTFRLSLFEIKRLSKKQKSTLNDIIQSIISKLSLLIKNGLEEPENDEGKIMLDYLQESLIYIDCIVVDD